jgi:hypothetical protein
LRDRLKRGHDGRHEAVLAWIVGGAVAWYAADRVLPCAPDCVAADTLAWRAEADAVLGFVADRLVRDHEAHVMARDLFAAFNAWLRERGHREWSDQTLASRLNDHQSWNGIERRQTYATTAGISRPPIGVPVPMAVPNRYQAWHGVRFRLPNEPDDEDVARGARGAPKVFTSLETIESLEHPLLPLPNGVGTVGR